MNKPNYEKIFTEESVWKSIFSMAVPSLITILVMVFYNMADMFFIGQLGNTAMVAAISIVGPVFGIIQGLATMIGAGGSVLIANSLGAQDPKKSRMQSSLCFWSSIVLGILMAVLVISFQDPLLSFLGANEEILGYAKEYMTILACGIPFMLCATAIGNIVRAEGAVMAGLIGNLLGTITNIILDPLFILIFHWGVPGAAIATVIGNMTAMLFYILHIHLRSHMLSLHPKDALKHPVMIFSVLALGLPNAVSTILSGLASNFSNRLLSGYGTDAIAAMAAAGKTSMLIGMVMIGICMGCQPLMSYAYGNNDKARMKTLLKDLTILTMGLGIFFAVFCFVLRVPIVHLFLKQDSAASLAESLVPYLILGSPFLGFYQISTNFLQAGRHASSAVLVSLLRQGLILIPLLYVCNAISGLTGIGYAHTISDILSSFISLLFFLHAYRSFQKQ